MELFNKLYQEQETLLRERGYNETATGSPDREGRLFTQLQRMLGPVVRDGTAYNIPLNFKLKTVGFFNEDLHIIIFDFDYKFDPRDRQLFLKQIHLRCDNMQRSITLKSNHDLPHSSEALDLLLHPTLQPRKPRVKAPKVRDKQRKRGR